MCCPVRSKRACPGADQRCCRRPTQTAAQCPGCVQILVLGPAVVACGWCGRWLRYHHLRLGCGTAAKRLHDHRIHHKFTFCSYLHAMPRNVATCPRERSATRRGTSTLQPSHRSRPSESWHAAGHGFVSRKQSGPSCSLPGERAWRGALGIAFVRIHSPSFDQPLGISGDTR